MALEILRELGAEIDNSGCSRRMVEVLCDCGNTAIKKLKYVKSGETKTCGSCPKVLAAYGKDNKEIYYSEPKDDELLMVDKTFNRWQVLEVGFVKSKSRVVKARCACGTISFVDKYNLVTLKSNSCGCYSRDLIGQVRKTHGESSSRTYQTWSNMLSRCGNENSTFYCYYGSLGITVRDRWKESFENFLEDMGEAPEGMTIDRVNPQGDYYKENCRWTDAYTQAWNRKKFKNNSSGKTGVYWNKLNEKWVASINVKGERLHLGTFERLEDAITTREGAEIMYYKQIKE